MLLLKIVNQAKRRIFKTYVVYIYNILTLIKFNIVTCMKVTGETLSFILKRKGAEEARY